MKLTQYHFHWITLAKAIKKKSIGRGIHKAMNLKRYEILGGQSKEWVSEWKSLSHVQLFATPPTYSPWNSPGQNTGVDNYSLIQGIFPTQGSNPGLLHCRWILYQLSHQGSPRILEWVAYLFSSRSSRPRNQTGVLRTANRFFIKGIVFYNSSSHS